MFYKILNNLNAEYQGLKKGTYFSPRQSRTVTYDCTASGAERCKKVDLETLDVQ